MAYENYEHLIISVDDGVAVVRMNRPHKLNAFNRVMARELLRAPAELRDDPAVRVVVLTGEGRGFCSGVDTSETGGPPSENIFSRAGMDELGYTGRLPTAWHEIDKPTIAALNGVAAGGGLALALAQDIRIAAESARLLPMFIRRGNSPEVGMSWSLPRIVGLQQALLWLYTGRELSGPQAKEIGLVVDVVPDDRLMPTVLEIAGEIAAGPPLAMQLTRRTVYHGLNLNLRDHLPYEAGNLSIGVATQDAEEARNALAERRKPTFQGR